MARRRTTDPSELFVLAQGGDRAATARLLSFIEDGGQIAREIGKLAFDAGGAAVTVGITGAPGAGKSTLTSCLVSTMRGEGINVGVLAIDPSSPFTGGAILGDRVRMGDHALDDGVFIRSMATRGHLGGLAQATPEAIRLLDAIGFPWVLVETVGVGQVEVEIAGAADTTLVVVNPGWGDAVQANKAGLMEIADIFVINKADRSGVAETRRDLDQMLDMGSRGIDGDWRPPIVPTIAAEGEGAEELWAAVKRHQQHAISSGERAERRRRRLDAELVRMAGVLVQERAQRVQGSNAYEQLREEVERRALDPWTAAERLLDDSRS
ncbi:MAG: methylmalonyl Co-A mutase-associated GTPase MeaB [Actinobacteria bacterium]|nr:methylmalonyl Co-A mutase-associated GTPase MeaB [Actinomycetota bacterium]